MLDLESARKLISVWCAVPRLDLVSEWVALIGFLMAGIPGYMVSRRLSRSAKLRKREAPGAAVAPGKRADDPATAQAAVPVAPPPAGASGAVELQTILTKHQELTEKMETMWTARAHRWLTGGLLLTLAASVLKVVLAYQKLIP